MIIAIGYVCFGFAIGWMIGRSGVSDQRQLWRDLRSGKYKLDEEKVQYRPPPPGWVEHMQEKATKLKEKQENSLFD